MDPSTRAEFCAEGGKIVEHGDLRDGLNAVDVVYSSPTVAAELPGDSRTGGGSVALCIDKAVLSAHAKPDLLVLHPLPRREEELSSDVDATGHNGYWQQAANGVTVRMALLTLVLGSSLDG